MTLRARYRIWVGAIICIGLLFLTVVLLNDAKHPGVTVSPPADSVDIDKSTPSGGTVMADDDFGVAFNNIFYPSHNDHIAQQSGLKHPSQLSNVFSIIARSKSTKYSETSATVINGIVYPIRSYKTFLTPNDPGANQWWVHTSKLDEAWDHSKGGSDVTIAIIDTGFALKHEEFESRWYENVGETGSVSTESASRFNCTGQSMALNQSCNLVDDDLDGIVDNEIGVTSYENPSQLNCTAQGKQIDKRCNNIDDDKNGFVDDVTGWDFINQDESVQAGQLSPTGTSTTHGTMVAGVAAATGNNSKGIAGVNWGARILPIQALDDDGYGDTVSVGNSIRYAVQQGAQVINISLGTSFHDPYVLQALEEASRAGIVVVAASGNDGCNCVSYPAAYPEVVAVGALNTDGKQADFSSYGSSLDVSAPGVNIRTSTWSQSNQHSGYASGIAGTSFSAPIVAGLIGIMLSSQPSAVPLQLIGGLGESSSRISVMTARGHDIKYGYGVIDAQRALTRMSTAKTGVLTYKFSPVSIGSKITVQGYERIGSTRVEYCEVQPATTPIYELRKADSKIFSISSAEVRRAQALGYTVSLFAYGCVNQPQDTYQLIRMIDIHKEFYNDYSKTSP